MVDISFDYNEFASSKLREWSDLPTRLEKKRIQKQIFNQNCREWLTDLVCLEPEEIEMVVENEGEAAAFKKDHWRYVRKAVYDEYTFKKKPISEEELDERRLKESGRKKTMELLQELKRQDQKSDDHARKTGDEHDAFSRRQDTSKKGGGEFRPSNGIKGKKWFIRPWLAKRCTSQESICGTDRNRQIFVHLQRLTKSALEENLKEKVFETMRLLKAGILFDAIYRRVDNMVRKMVNEAGNIISNDNVKWLDKLVENSPETITDHMIDEIFEEAPLSYFQDKITQHFVDALTIPVSDSLIKTGIVSKDPSQITTKFETNTLESLVKKELSLNPHICTSFNIAEKVAENIADEVIDVARFRLDVPARDGEHSETERDLKALHEQRVHRIGEKAKIQARKHLEHLRSPSAVQNSLKNPRISTAKGNCNCSKISDLGGKKKPFSFPEYKKKHNYYFYNKFISDKKNKSTSAVLYPKTKPHLKLVCDDRWKCIEVPLERELRDIPYRFSYAPQYVVNQIKWTKSIKRSDDPLIRRILRKMRETKKAVDLDSILKKIFESKGIALEQKTPSGAKCDSSNECLTSDLPSARSLLYTETKESSYPKVRPRTSTGSSKFKGFPSQSESNLSMLERMKKATVVTTKTKELKLVSRESLIPKAEEMTKYHEHILQGYRYSMVPITPCRFHSLKKIKTILKRFETAGGPAALEFHYDSKCRPVNVDELLPIPRLVDSYRQWKTIEKRDTSLWTRALNDSRLSRMAKFRKLFHKDPVFGFMSNWDNTDYKCPL